MVVDTSASSRAFSLIELLVVISIIAILSSMLLPAISTVRSAARSAVCQSHLRQIGQAVSAYTVDYEGVLPFGTYKDGSNWGDKVLEQLEVDATSGMLRCPSAAIPLGIRHYGAQFNLFAMEGRVPTPPATTTGGWRARSGSVRELRTDGALIFDVSQSLSTGNCKTLPTEIGIMWNWFNNSSDDRLTINTPLNVDTDAWALDRYRHSGNRMGNFLWGDFRVSSRGYADMVKGNFRCYKNGRKQSWEPN
jgi:prepilin-type N-terminal cleavage/methylation domain-containing protein